VVRVHWLPKVLWRMTPFNSPIEAKRASCDACAEIRTRVGG
jgi:hypothetical protein